MGTVARPPARPAGRGKQRSPRRPGISFTAVNVLRCAVIVAAALTVLSAFGLPSQARADAPGRLTDNVEAIASEHCDGPVVWVRYVTTSAGTAARLIGKSRRELHEGTPDRVHLVVMRGDFSLAADREVRAPYLAFLSWHDGEYWNASDFTLLHRAVPLESAGTPRTIESFALAHPTLQRASEYALAGLVVFGPAVLLVACAVLCEWRRGSAWPFMLAACATVAVACWQVTAAVLSVWSPHAGWQWDPVFHGIKFGVLAVVVGVDLAAAVVLLRARPSTAAVGQVGGSRVASHGAAATWLVLAAVLYVLSWYFVATTGE
jgi:hypothetical protein